MKRFPAWPALAIACAASCGDTGSDPADNSPEVSLVSPNGGEFAPTQAVSWRARDSDDGDILTIDLELLILDESNEVQSSEFLATGLENFVGVDSATFDWQRDDVPLVNSSRTPIRYAIRVTATDLAGNTSSDESDEAFTLLDAGALENLDWDDVGPIFKRYCKRCHGEPAASLGIEYFRLDKYNAGDPEPPANAMQGVFEMRESVERQLLQLGNMPPFGNSQPSDLDKMRIQNWLDDGAPFSLE